MEEKDKKPEKKPVNIALLNMLTPEESAALEKESREAIKMFREMYKQKIEKEKKGL